MVGNDYNSNQDGRYIGQQSNTVPIMGNNKGVARATMNENTVIIHEEDKYGELEKRNGQGMINQNALQQILESKQFQATLAKAVAPQVSKQVSSLVAPTLKKISQIESQVGELHEYVKNNAQWQDTQTRKQSTMQVDVQDVKTSVNQMQSSMNAILEMFQGQQHNDTGKKGPHQI